MAQSARLQRCRSKKRNSVYKGAWQTIDPKSTVRRAKSDPRKIQRNIRAETKNKNKRTKQRATRDICRSDSITRNKTLSTARNTKRKNHCILAGYNQTEREAKPLSKSLRRIN